MNIMVTKNISVLFVHLSDGRGTRNAIPLLCLDVIDRCNSLYIQRVKVISYGIYAKMGPVG